MAVEKAVRVTISATDEFSSVMTGMGASWRNIALMAGAAEAAIIAASVQMAQFAVNLGERVFEEAGVFHDAILDVSAVAQSFGTTAEEISDILDDLVVKFPLTGQQAGEALELIAQMGFGAKDELVAMSEAAVTLQIATGTDLETAARGALAAMNTFGLELAEAERVTNLFAAAQFSSAATVSDLSEAMKFAGPTAQLLGISIEETVGMLAQLRDIGLEASQTGTVFRMGLLTLQQEMPKTIQALDELGISFEDVNPSANTLTEIIEEFDGKTISAEQAVALFGVRSAALATIINQGSESFRTYVESITDTNAAADAMEEKMRQWGNVANQVEGDMSALMNVIGRDLLDAVIAVVGTSNEEGIRGFITQLNELESEGGGIGSVLVNTFQSIAEAVREAFTDNFDSVEDFYLWLVQMAEFLGANLEILTAWGGALVDIFVGATTESSDLQVYLDLINGAILALALPVAALHDVFASLWYMIELGVDTSEWLFAQFMVAVNEGLRDIAVLADALPFVDMSDQIAQAEEAITQWKEVADEAFDSEPPRMWGETVANAYWEAESAIDGVGTAAEETGDKLEDAAGRTADAARTGRDELESLLIQAELVAVSFGDSSTAAEYLESTIRQIAGAEGNAVDVAREFLTEVNKLQDSGMSLSDAIDTVSERMFTAKERTDETAASMSKAEVSIVKAADGSITLQQNLQQASTAAKDTDEALSDLEKHQLSLEAAQFEADLEMAQLLVKNAHEKALAELEWEAKLEIADLEANAEIVTAAFDAIGESVSSTAEAAADMFEALAGFTGSEFERFQLEKFLQQQLDIEQDLAESQIALNDAQIENIKKRTELLDRGDALYNIGVSIEGDVTGWLNGLLTELLQEIMIKATQEEFYCSCAG
jgi:TP901 family phage tail tape measure protein